jgi:omega-amidase
VQLTISLAQMQIIIGQPLENLQIARGLIQEAASRGSQLILLPELWTSGYDLENTAAIARTNEELLHQISTLAHQYGIWIGGSLLLERNGHHYNTFVLNNPSGSDPIYYQKIHLFGLMGEDRWLGAGSQTQMAQAEWGPAGLAVCYDLRFPELFRKYSLSGAKIFLLCAEWPAQRISHWQTLLRARAIENQCFMAAVNSAGQTGSELFGGCSSIISPWGEVLVESLAVQPDLLTVTIDLAQVAEIRAHIPVFKDRRPELY